MARLLLQILVFALPFAAYFIWREIARRHGREMGSTPWGWIIAAGFLAAGLSLVILAFLPQDSGVRHPDL